MQTNGAVHTKSTGHGEPEWSIKTYKDKEKSCGSRHRTVTGCFQIWLLITNNGAPCNKSPKTFNSQILQGPIKKMG